MDSHTLKAKHLLKFLLKKRLFDAYFENLFHQKGNTKSVNQYCMDKDVIKLLEHWLTIDDSFTWSDTPQGHGFWSDLNEEELRQYDYMIKDIKFMTGKKTKDYYFYEEEVEDEGL
jgi:hypothetical protein